ncbi:MAG TPA: hypothetical protein VKY19_24260 [Ktedonosporobacter sp.]|jgi:hypothetical protein|nr:hypothetical protein [Ktedonosporobacter sp.]
MSQRGNDPIGSQDDDNDEYSTVPDVPYQEGDDDDLEHNDSGFCDNMAHACHENQQSITKLNSAIVDGLITEGDADLIYRGKTVI